MSIQQTVMGRLRGGKKRSLSLRMTAMIDVIFLLLIFFILTAKFHNPEQFLSLLFRDSESQVRQKSPIESLQIDITVNRKECIIDIGKISKVIISELTIEQSLLDFAEKLSEIMRQQNRTINDPVEIKCADNVKWDYLMKIYNVLNAAGIQNITFNVSLEEGIDNF